MKRFLIFFIAWYSGLAGLYSQPFPNPAIDVQKYIFRLEINDLSQTIKGEARLEITFRENGIKSFFLDLVNQSSALVGKGMQVSTILSNNEEVAFTHRSNRLTLSLKQAPQKGETLTFDIRYSGVPADGLIISENIYGRKTFFGDNWPDRAHHWLPVVDHPADKALVEFIIVAPQKYQVVANGTLVEETDLRDGERLTHWRSTVPLPTKVMVFGAAEFAVEYLDEFRNIPVTSWVYPQNREAGFYDYQLALPVLTFMADYIGPYPYSKLANVQSTTRYGGMENASNIFYAENSVTGERTSEELIAHEIAHQWFGNSASEASWYHIWLSEGFATYFALLYLEYAHGPDRMAIGLRENRETVIQSGPNAPVVDEEITNLNFLLNANSYQKGGWVLHMLRQKIGDDAFRKGIRTYYERYQLSNALTDDFRKVMEEVSGQNLKDFFQQWLFTAGHPKLKVTWEYDNKKNNLAVKVQQIQATPFQFPLELGIFKNSSGEPETHTLEVSKPEQSFDISMKYAPALINLDPNTRLLFEGEIREE